VLEVDAGIVASGSGVSASGGELQSFGARSNAGAVHRHRHGRGLSRAAAHCFMMPLRRSRCTQADVSAATQRAGRELRLRRASDER
jgi:hypothetical protein